MRYTTLSSPVSCAIGNDDLAKGETIEKTNDANHFIQ